MYICIFTVLDPGTSFFHCHPHGGYHTIKYIVKLPISNNIKNFSFTGKVSNPSRLFSTIRSLSEYYGEICDIVILINKHTENFFFFLFMSKFHKLLSTLYNLMSSFGKYV